MSKTAVLSAHTTSSPSTNGGGGESKTTIVTGSTPTTNSTSAGGKALADFLPPFTLAARPEQQLLSCGRVLNFSPVLSCAAAVDAAVAGGGGGAAAEGPACLPLEVLQEIQGELLNWHGTGMSALELNHRGIYFARMLEESKGYMQKLLMIPDTHQLMFMQGGGTAQFAALPLNWLHRLGDTADYVLSGYWSRYALKEGKKYGDMRAAGTSEAAAWAALPPVETWTVNPAAAYIHYCDNETIGGLEFPAAPDLSKAQMMFSPTSAPSLSPPPLLRQAPERSEAGGEGEGKREGEEKGGGEGIGAGGGATNTVATNEVAAKHVGGGDEEFVLTKKRLRAAQGEWSVDMINSSNCTNRDWRWHLAADMSSNFCSKPIDFEKYGLIYEEELTICPSVLSYRLCAKADSALNTPPVFSMYVVGLMAKYILQRGGLHAWETYCSRKAQLLYDVIDASDGFYEGVVTEKEARSRLNVCFRVVASPHTSNTKHTQRKCSLLTSTHDARSSNSTTTNSSSINSSKTSKANGVSGVRVEEQQQQQQQQEKEKEEKEEEEAKKKRKKEPVDHSGLGVRGPTGPPFSKAKEVGETKPREHAALAKKFLQKAEAAGFYHLGGHRTAGGCRASIYTGMSLEGVERLATFMKVCFRHIQK